MKRRCCVWEISSALVRVMGFLLTTATILFYTSGCSGCVKTPPKLVVGKWQNEAGTSSLEFLSDGTIRASFPFKIASGKKLEDAPDGFIIDLGYQLVVFEEVRQNIFLFGEGNETKREAVIKYIPDDKKQIWVKVIVFTDDERRIKVKDEIQGQKVRFFKTGCNGPATLYVKIDNRNITDEEIQSFYNERKSELFTEKESVRARHILVAASPDATENEEKAAKNLIEDIRQRALAGEDFARLAKKYSADRSSREQGGDLGYFTRSRMIKQFEDVAFSTEVGQISEVFRTESGFHILKVDDKKPERIKNLEEVRDYIVATLREQGVRVNDLLFTVDSIDLEFNWRGTLSMKGLYRFTGENRFEVYIPLGVNGSTLKLLVCNGSVDRSEILINGIMAGIEDTKYRKLKRKAGAETEIRKHGGFDASELPGI